MKERWFNLWNGLGASGDPKPIYEDLVRRYSEPGRAYHNLHHIEHCLSELAAFAYPVPDRDAIEFALWFHDAIYDTKAKDSEERSAELAREVALSAGLRASFIEQVVDLILATKHTMSPTTPGARLIVDVDLAILGQPEPAFDEYERQIREEYRWVSEANFRAGRSAILERFRGQERIYSTPYFYSRYEAIARQNLALSIVRLRTLS